MLVFNCTKAAKEFFTKTIKNKKHCPVIKAQSKDFSDDKHWIHFENGEVPSEYNQWIVHVIKVQRKNFIIAMSLEHRFAMVFNGIKKRDASSFISHFYHRLFHFLLYTAADFNLVEDNEKRYNAIYDKFKAIHRQEAFIERSDRSVIGHIKETAYRVEVEACQNDKFLDTKQAQELFDFSVNHFFRSSKASRAKEGSDGYFTPLEELFVDYAEKYIELSSGEISKFKDGYQEYEREKVDLLLIQRALSL